MAEIISAVSESLDTTKCQGSGDCHNGSICLTHHLWKDLSEQIHGYLSGISLADLISKREISQIAQDQHVRHLGKLENGLVENSIETIASSG
jgi:Rrf2 family iron-sulfur cluster assembly transcriptional regulator